MRFILFSISLRLFSWRDSSKINFFCYSRFFDCSRSFFKKLRSCSKRCFLSYFSLKFAFVTLCYSRRIYSSSCLRRSSFSRSSLYSKSSWSLSTWRLSAYWSSSCSRVCSADSNVFCALLTDACSFNLACRELFWAMRCSCSCFITKDALTNYSFCYLSMIYWLSTDSFKRISFCISCLAHESSCIFV